MYKQTIAIFGAAFLAIGIMLFLIPRVPLYFSYVSEWLDFSSKMVVTTKDPSWVLEPLGECRNAASVITTKDSQIMSESDSQTISAAITNGSKISCEYKLELSAPGFTKEPDKVEQITLLSSGESNKVRWIITPSKVGNFSLFINAYSRPLVTQSSGDARNEYDYVYLNVPDGDFKIRVTNILGLSAAQAHILSLIGTFLGPLLTLPWWLEKWEKRKKKRSQVKKNL